MFEIASGKLAQAKGNEAEKKFAEQMITDHTKTSSELKRLVTGGTLKVELPIQLDSAHQSKLDKLNQARGEDSRRPTHAQQVSAHKDAVSLFERYANGGDQPELKDWAGQDLAGAEASSRNGRTARRPASRADGRQLHQVIATAAAVMPLTSLAARTRVRAVARRRAPFLLPPIKRTRLWPRISKRLPGNANIHDQKLHARRWRRTAPDRGRATRRS